MAQPPVMAQKEFTRLPSGLRRAEVPGNEDAPGPVEMLGSYLELVEQCNEAVQKMHSRRFNREQCQYLAEKLQVVVLSAKLFFKEFCAQFNGPGSSEDTVRCVEISKLLVALSKQIESFVQGCCKDTWMQAAMTLTNASEYVSSLGFNLELCRLAFEKSRCLTIKEVSDLHKHEVKIVKRKAVVDSEDVFAEVTHGLTEKSLFSNDEKELGAYLIQRLHRVKAIPHNSVTSGASWLSTVGEASGLGKIVKYWVTQKEKLGRGASGTVYKALWLGTPVAKKRFHTGTTAHFDREARILAGLCHPNITSMFCSHAENEKNYSIIMELMDEDLFELIQRRSNGSGGASPFTLFEAIDIMLQVGEGVRYLHNLNPSIVHRDLKSANILVKCVAGKESESGYVHAKVADFGLSKTLDSSERFSHQSSNLGTNRWMAPEVIQSAGGNQIEISWSEMGRHPQKSDVFSFGMVCYEILTGDVPFGNDNATVAKKKVKRGDRPKLPDHCPRKLKELIMKCWSKDPQQRPGFDDICDKLKHLKYLSMTGYTSNYQGHHPATEELLQTDEADTLQSSYDNQELVDSDCQTAEECVYRIVSCITSIELCTPSVRFNHLLCERFMSKYLHHVREFLEEQRDKIGEPCAPALAALYSTVKEAKSLIRKHCASSSTSWKKDAVELVGNTSAFAEVILDLKWYVYALKIAIKAASAGTSCPKVANLQRLAMADFGDFLQSWERDCKLLRLDWDREVLLSKLKSDSSSSAKIRSLDSYLAEKLDQLDQSMHVRAGAFAVNLKAEGFFHRNKPLGLGSLGRVYSVRWHGVSCSLKEIDGKTDVDDEVGILFKLLHPNIIQSFGYFVEDGKLCLVTERLQTTLSDYIQSQEWRDLQKSPFFLKVALDCMLQIVKGLRYLHSQGIAHKDLKSDNVLVRPSTNPNLQKKGYLTLKLADFGLAKANLTNYSDASNFTDLNVGTLVWKAPELFKLVQSTISESTSSYRKKCKHYPFKLDVYSFGMVSYEILAGKKPFSHLSGLSPSLLFAKVKRGERPELPSEDMSFQLPDGLTDYIWRCWDTDPFRRPDFFDICKQVRHFRDSLLQITAFDDCETFHELPSDQGLKTRLLEDPSIIDENDFMIDITGEWSWEIDNADVVVLSDKPIFTGRGFAEVWPVRLNRSYQKMLAKHIELTLTKSDDSIASFKHEMGLLVRKQHRNLVSYLGATRQTPFVVFTEFVYGVTLRKFSEKDSAAASSQGDPILARRHRFREEVDIALQVACGVQFLHEGEIPIIHGEISPDCILIDENSMTARVADFGLRSFKIAPNKWQPRWYRRAPEQKQGVPLHTSMDVFSFGTILYDLFEPQKSQQFWKHKKANVRIEKGTRPTLDLASSYPKGLKSLVQRCWSQNPQERPDFKTIISELEDMATHLSRSKFFQTEAVNRDVGDHGSKKR